MRLCILGAGALGSAIGGTRPRWGIVILPSELISQREEVVQLGEQRNEKAFA